MKKNEWIIAMIVCGLMSCSKTENKLNPESVPLLFSGHVQKNTKGQAYTGTKLNQAFRVTAYALNSGEALDMDHLSYVMSKQLVTTEDQGVSFQYAPLMFFPYGKELICCAYSPESVSGMQYHPTQGETDMPYLSVEVPLDISLQKDIMMAYSSGVTALNSVNGISLNFQHILSQITFAAKTTQANLKIRLKKIQIENVASGGACSFNHAPEFYEVTGSETYTQLFEGSMGDVHFNNPGFKTLTDPSTAMLLIPQDLSQCRLSVSYDAYINLPGESDYETVIALNETKSVQLSGHWEPGMAYRYELSIQPGTPLNFETTVNTWVDRNVGAGL